MKLKVMAAAVLGGALLGAGGGAGALVLAAPPDRSGTALHEIERGDAALDDLAAQIASARMVADVVASGQEATRVAASTEERSRRLARIEDGRIRAPARRLVDAQASLARALAPLATLETPDPEHAESVRDAVIAALGEVERRRRGLPVELRSAADDRWADPTFGTARTVETLRRGQRRLALWRSKRVSIRRARKSRVAVLDSYASSFKDYLGRYQGLRTAMSDWIRKVDTEGETFAGAYDFLSEASAERSRMRAAFRSLDAPKVVARQHNQVLSVLDRAVQAVDDAYSGIVDLQFDFDDLYDSYRDTPGWRSFSSTSDSIAGEYDAAVAAWRKRLAHTRKGILESGLPARPQV